MVYRCDDPEAPELYVDPESLSLTLKLLIKRQWIDMILTLIWAGLILREPLANLFTAPALLPLPLILYTEILLLVYLILFACVAAQLLRTIFRLVKLRRLRRQLASRILPAAGKRRYQASWDNFTALAAILCFVYVVFWGISGDMRTQYLESPEEWDFPHVMLSELVPENTELCMYSSQEMLVFDKFKHSLAGSGAV